jgi:hypothetical protein
VLLARGAIFPGSLTSFALLGLLVTGTLMWSRRKFRRRRTRVRKESGAIGRLG